MFQEVDLDDVMVWLFVLWGDGSVSAAPLTPGSDVPCPKCQSNLWLNGVIRGMEVLPHSLRQVLDTYPTVSLDPERAILLMQLFAEANRSVHMLARN